MAGEAETGSREENGEKRKSPGAAETAEHKRGAKTHKDRKRMEKQDTMSQRRRLITAVMMLCTEFGYK